MVEISTWAGPSGSPSGAGMYSRIASKRGFRLVPGWFRSRVAEARLGHRALEAVHQQQHAVHHLQHALHLAAEVRVAGGVHNVDLVAHVVHGGVLGQDGDAPLALDVAGVHHAVDGLLVLMVHAALLEHLVDQGRLAVVDVGDDGNVADIFTNHK